MINKKLITKVIIAAGVATVAFTGMANAQVINPYEPIKGEWIELPDGRIWGATSTVYYAGNGNIWVAERCGANSNCLDTPDIDPIML